MYNDKIENLVEICDHVFIISDLKIADKYSIENFENQTTIKICDDKKFRKYCEICEKNFAAAVYTYDKKASFICVECYQNFVTPEDDENYDA